MITLIVISVILASVGMCVVWAHMFDPAERRISEALGEKHEPNIFLSIPIPIGMAMVTAGFIMLLIVVS